MNQVENLDERLMIMEKSIFGGLHSDFGLTYGTKENYSFVDQVFSSYLLFPSKLE